MPDEVSFFIGVKFVYGCVNCICLSILFCNLVRCLIDFGTEGIMAHDLVSFGWHWVLGRGVTHTSLHVKIDNFFCFVAVLLLLTMYIYVKVLLFVCHHMPLLGPLIIIKVQSSSSNLKRQNSC